VDAAGSGLRTGHHHAVSTSRFRVIEGRVCPREQLMGAVAAARSRGTDTDAHPELRSRGHDPRAGDQGPEALTDLPQRSLIAPIGEDDELLAPPATGQIA
jgi:hypothetical protein